MAQTRSFGNIRKLPKTDARRWLATVDADLVRGHWIDPDAGTSPFACSTCDA